MKLIEKYHETKRSIAADKSWGFSLPEEKFIYGMSLLTPQSYGGRLERYIANKYGLVKISSQKNTGDLLNPKTQKTYEIKNSIITHTNPCLNMVQIRLFQKIDYYVCIGYDIRDLTLFKKKIFVLSHKDMEKECELYGTNAHGTKKTNTKNKNIEIRFNIKFEENDERFERWCKKYTKDEENIFE